MAGAAFGGNLRPALVTTKGVPQEHLHPRRTTAGDAHAQSAPAPDAIG